MATSPLPHYTIHAPAGGARKRACRSPQAWCRAGPCSSRWPGTRAVRPQHPSHVAHALASKHTPHAQRTVTCRAACIPCAPAPDLAAASASMRAKRLFAAREALLPCGRHAHDAHFSSARGVCSFRPLKACVSASCWLLRGALARPVVPVASPCCVPRQQVPKVLPCNRSSLQRSILAKGRPMRRPRDAA